MIRSNMKRRSGIAASLALLAALSCNGTTGDALVSFTAYAAGAPHAGDPFTVDVPNGDGAPTPYTVQIKSATMHIGAVYLDQDPPETSSCIDTGLYADQVPGAVDVDLLSTTPQAFTIGGNGTADPNQSFQIWLTDGTVAPTSLGEPSDTINSENYVPTLLLQATATNQNTGVTIPFSAFVTINAANRGTSPSDPAYPGQNPICAKRIVDGPLNNLTISPGDSLLLTIDPRTWFSPTINFAEFAPITSEDCLGDPSAEPPDFPEVGITPTSCIPNDNNTASTAGAPIGSQFLVDILAGGPDTYQFSILKSQ